MFRSTHVIGTPVGNTPSLLGLTSALQPLPQLGTENSRTLFSCGVNSRCEPEIWICGDRSVTVPRSESLVVIFSSAQYVPVGTSPVKLTLRSPPPESGLLSSTFPALMLMLRAAKFAPLHAGQLNCAG